MQITIVLLIIIVLIVVFVAWNYDKIPSYDVHKNRNNNNIMPTGNLTETGKKDLYIDENQIMWCKRKFLQSLFHNPFANYVFETCNANEISSSEVLANKQLFNAGKQLFTPSSFNFYSSYNYPISHLFADVLPALIAARHDQGQAPGPHL